jgi:hypothetical protein
MGPQINESTAHGGPAVHDTCCISCNFIAVPQIGCVCIGRASVMGHEPVPASEGMSTVAATHLIADAGCEVEHAHLVVVAHVLGLLDPGLVGYDELRQHLRNRNHSWQLSLPHDER